MVLSYRAEAEGISDEQVLAAVLKAARLRGHEGCHLRPFARQITSHGRGVVSTATGEVEKTGGRREDEVGDPTPA